LSYGGHAKLSDLEYAKKRGESISHEMRTASESPISFLGKPLIAYQQGTMHFMSVEVAAHDFLFTPQQRVSMANLEQQDENPAQAGQTGIPFTHNHLHDLESLWWVAVSFLFYHHISKENNSKEKNSKEKSSVPSVTFHDTEQRIELAQTLFPPSGDLATRQHIFQNLNAFQEKYRKLPTEHHQFGARLDFLRKHLINKYQDVEAGLPQSINPDSSDEVYDNFKTIFTLLKPKYVGTKLEYLPNIHKELSKVEKAKRRRSELTNDPEGASASKSIKTTHKT
jgi:hypothetical protein